MSCRGEQRIGSNYKQAKEKERKAVCPVEGKVQQSSIQPEESESAAKEEGSQREIKRTFKILREVWLNIGVEKLDTHEDITIKALLDSNIIEMFMDRKMAARHGFKLQKLERPTVVRNIDGTNNSGGVIIHQIEVNVYYKNHVERMRINICDLGKTKIILGMPQLAAHNPEINQEIEKVKITRYLPLCGGIKSKEEKKKKESSNSRRRENCQIGDK